MKKSGKKLCALALAAAMLGLTACGSSSGTTDTTTAAAGGAAATEETTAAAAVAEGESVSQDTDIIGAVLVIGVLAGCKFRNFSKSGVKAPK